MGDLENLLETWRSQQAEKILSDFRQESLKMKNVNLMELVSAPLVLARQPSERWLDELKTPDQINAWLGYRCHFCLIAEYWAITKTARSDHFRVSVEAGELSRNEYNIIRRSQKVFERTWELCRECEPFIRESFEKANFDSPFSHASDLFEKVMDELTTAQIEVILSPYVERSRPKREKALRLLVKVLTGGQLKVTEWKAIKAAYHPRLPKPCIMQLLLEAAQVLAWKDPVIQDALIDYWTAWARLLESYATQWRASGSYAWHHGQKVKAKGTVYPASS
jgi:hypothetical protein